MEGGRKGLLGLRGHGSRDLLRAFFPLLEAGRVDCLEVTLEAASSRDPEWFRGLWQEFARGGALTVKLEGFDPFADPNKESQRRRLRRIRNHCRELRPRQLVAAFGFRKFGVLESGGMLPMPYCESALLRGVENLHRLQHAVEGPVGLENPAMAFSLEEARRQGEFLERVLEPVNGFLHLDLHALYCQMRNFGRSAEELLSLLPLHRVRSLQLGGGSWSNHGLRTLCRNTHDGPVPEECFLLLERLLPLLPGDVVVVLGRSPGSAGDPVCREELLRSFTRLERILGDEPDRCVLPRNFQHRNLPLAGPGTEAEDYREALVEALATLPDGERVKARLLEDPRLSGFYELLQGMEAELLEMAQLQVRCWGQGTAPRRRPRGQTKAASSGKPAAG